MYAVEQPTGGAWPRHTTPQRRSTHCAQNKNSHTRMHMHAHTLPLHKKPPFLAYVSDALQFAGIFLPPFPSSWLSQPLQLCAAVKTLLSRQVVALPPHGFLCGEPTSLNQYLIYQTGFRLSDT